MVDVPPQRRTIALQSDAHALMASLSPSSLQDIGEAVRAWLGAPLALSTCFGGDRPNGLPADRLADLKALSEVIGPSEISREPSDADCHPDLTLTQRFIRQLEGHPPATAGLLDLHSEASLLEIEQEVHAAGFSLDRGPEGLALRGPQHISVEDDGEADASGSARLTAMADVDWDHFQSAADQAGAMGFSAISDPFASPLAAAQAGIFGKAHIERRDGRPWRFTVTLPKAGHHGVTQRLWSFTSADQAEVVFQKIIDRFAPLFMETLPPLDGQIMAAVGDMKRPQRKRLREPGGAGLRVAFYGTWSDRWRALAAASWSIERAGGVCHHRGALSSSAFIDALLVASGAARVTVPQPSSLEADHLPKHHRWFHRLRAVHGKVRKDHSLYYIRDLSQSLEELDQLSRQSRATAIARSDIDQAPQELSTQPTNEPRSQPVQNVPAE